MMRRIALLAFISLIAVSGCVFDFDLGFNLGDYRYKFEDHFEKDFGTEVDQVALTIVNGSITIETWASDRVEIEIHERIKADDDADAEELANAVTLVGEVKGSTLDISLDYGSMYNKRRNYACNLEIKLPKRLKLNLNTTNGSIDIPAMDGMVRADTTNGSVRLDGCGSDAELSTTNGEIKARAVAGELSAHTTNGGLDLEADGGSVTGITTNGGVDLTMNGPLKGNVRLESTNGGIEMAVDPASGFTVKADTSNGSVEDNLSGASFSYNRRRTTMSGSYGDGAFTITLDTTNGNIRLRER